MPEHDLKNAKAFFGATSAGPWSDAGLGAMTLLKRSKNKNLLAPIFDSRIADSRGDEWKRTGRYDESTPALPRPN